MKNMPDPHAVPTFDVDHVTMSDGRSAMILSYRPTGVQGLSVDASALRSALAGAPVDVVVFHPWDTDRSALLQAATACGPTRPVLATAAPVTDAVKRVRGPLVVDTVDRGSLAWAVGPAAVEAAGLADHLQRAAGTTVWPLTGSGEGVAWL